MRRIVFSVSNSYEGISLRSFLRSYVKISSRLCAKLKRQPGGISRNGLPVKAPDTLHSGDLIALCLQEGEEKAVPVPIPVRIIWEDPDLLICDKPAEMPMYPCPGHPCDSLENAVAYIQLQAHKTFTYRPVYRLDQGTTGLVILAKNAYAASRLAGSVQKTYLAVCEGKLAGSGLIDKPIGLKPGHTIQRAVIACGDCAVTRWRTIFCTGSCSFIAVHLKTGRTHQIRVHFSDFGHPLAGDDMYGGSRKEITRPALHCAEIHFRHPVTGKAIRLRSALPEDMLILLKGNRNDEK